MSQMQFQILTNHPSRRERFLSKAGWNICANLLLTIGVSGSCLGDPVSAAIFDRSGRKIPDREVNSDLVNWQMLSTAAGRKYNGIGVIDIDYGVCTGFLIATGIHPDTPAYVLTNGHCQGRAGKLPGDREIIVDRSSKTNFIVNYFHDFKPDRLTIPVKRIVYGTMKNNDIAILELTKTQRELAKAGINPLQIDLKPPDLGEPLIVVGVPSEGLKEELTFLHATTCQTGELANVKEDIYHWKHSIRHQCSIVGGMSGSPMISLKKMRVVGIINTGVNDNASKQPQCSLNRPCEVGKHGFVQTFPQENYGQLVDRIPTCFDRRGIFNLYQPNCQLERP
ncbi:serine protease [Chamaesiphon sp. VAR_48_metabat_135_sub]|uniref:trypsin-like serine peptidase n=1 Tax=Chamaesiphon sp. VAR_48_metabat_135_sub TaxID=2964699 RepID=UPI00286B179F|nr:serine protease [Chamaesiphon sp. VAR_48_metabat_135_sub]